MTRIISIALGLALSASAFAQDISLEGFNKRFKVVRDNDGRVTQIKLKRATTTFSIMPYIEQIKDDLLGEQRNGNKLSSFEKEAKIDALLADMGLDPYAKDNNEEVQAIKDSLMNIDNINVQAAFDKLKEGTFWKEFESKINEAFLFIDPTILTNGEDARFFYRKNVTHQVVNWALQLATKKFSDVPVLNMASYIIVHVHDMMLEQRYFAHNMLLHYFETIPETKLGMTKEDVDRARSSIYEYRIEPVNILESNRAAADWLNYGANSFYTEVRMGMNQMKSWQAPLSSLGFSDVKRMNFAFASVTENGSKKIYHLHNKSFMFSSKPALAYDYAKPKRVKMNRTLLNLAGASLGFLPIPAWIKQNANAFIESFYVKQVRMEGALIGHFESMGNQHMIDQIYSQRANYYIVR